MRKNRVRKCPHPKATLIVDPFEEGRGICGACGAQTASSDLVAKALRMLERMDEDDGA